MPSTVTVFTEYVRALEPRRDRPGDDLVSRLWEGLRGALIGEMKKRGQWTASPAYLGIEGGSWSDGKVFEELLAECYAFIFVRRLRGLLAQLKVKENVDGIVFLSIRNFLHDSQKKYDPLGFRVFDVLQSAILRSLEEERLFILAGDPKIRNDTVLGFSLAGDPEGNGHVDYAAYTSEWLNHLLPDLVTARGEDVDDVVCRLADDLQGLAEIGVESFRFHDVVDPLKSDVRRRWSALWRQAEGEMANEDNDEDRPARVAQVLPDTSLEDRQAFEEILLCVAGGLEDSGERKKTRTYLERLWTFERNRSTTPEERPLSRRKIGDLLDIPRHRLPELYEKLGRLVEKCRDKSSRSEKSAVNPKWKVPPSGTSPNQDSATEQRGSMG